MMKKLGLFTFLVLFAFLAGCAEPKSPATGTQAQPEQQSDILALLEQNHPDYFKSIAVHGTNPTGTMLCFLRKQGGTYVFRMKPEKIEPIHHAKRIGPSQITRISYSDGFFVLWAGDRKELSIGISE